MEKTEFHEIFKESLNLIDIGLEEGYFNKKDKQNLYKKLIEVMKRKIRYDIPGKAIYGVYSNKILHYNAKVYKSREEALIYILHEMKHSLDDFGDRIGFDGENGVGMNEGATQRFATNVAEKILGYKIESKIQKSLGIYLETNLDEYQLEDRLNSLFCQVLGISETELLRMQNASDKDEFKKLIDKFNEHADFDVFNKALDEIYKIQEETWIDEFGELLEEEKEATKEQTDRAKELIKVCQEELLKYVRATTPDKVSELKRSFIIKDYKDIDNIQIEYQNDYQKYQDFISNSLKIENANIVFVGGLGGYQYDHLTSDHYIVIKDLLDDGESLGAEIVIRRDDKYFRIFVSYNKEGIIKQSKEEPFNDFERLIDDIIVHSQVIGNYEETLILYKLTNKSYEKIRYFKEFYLDYLNNKNEINKIIEIKDEQIKEELKEIEMMLCDLNADSYWECFDNDKKIK